jgi:hypothetical protein
MELTPNTRESIISQANNLIRRKTQNGNSNKLGKKKPEFIV